MLGKTTLFVPGFDHAGISTQSVVEKRLYKASGKTRHDLEREEFLKTVWDWKNDYQSRITTQLQRLGGSYDWDRVAFTMDEVSFSLYQEYLDALIVYYDELDCAREAPICFILKFR